MILLKGLKYLGALHNDLKIAQKNVILSELLKRLAFPCCRGLPFEQLSQILEHFVLSKQIKLETSEKKAD